MPAATTTPKTTTPAPEAPTVTPEQAVRRLSRISFAASLVGGAASLMFFVIWGVVSQITHDLPSAIAVTTLMILALLATTFLCGYKALNQAKLAGLERPDLALGGVVLGWATVALDTLYSLFLLIGLVLLAQGQ